MKKECEVLINESNKGRSNIYYQLNQLNNITGLSTRMLKYKMNKVKEQYANVPSLLMKDGRKWKIHISLINLFMPVKNRKTYAETNYKWKSFTTWSPQHNYDKDYHIELINQVKKELPNSIIKYAIELNSKGFNHVHFVSDTSADIMKKAVEKVVFAYLTWSEVSLEVKDIINQYSSVSYTNKAPVIAGVIYNNKQFKISKNGTN